MEAHRIQTVLHEGKQMHTSEIIKVIAGTRDDFVRMAKSGRVMAVQHLFLLANPSLPGKGGARRRDFYAAVDRIEERGAILWELYTGRRSDDPKQRDLMLRDAIEAMATGRHKRTSRDRRGRPPKEFSEEQLAKGKAVWESRRYKTWDEAAKHLPEGMNKWDAWEEFGPREDD